MKHFINIRGSESEIKGLQALVERSSMYNIINADQAYDSESWLADFQVIDEDRGLTALRFLTIAGIDVGRGLRPYGSKVNPYG